MAGKNLPAKQMFCLLVNCSTGRFILYTCFLNYYQCHKDCRAALVASSVPVKCRSLQKNAEKWREMKRNAEICSGKMQKN